jgi:predicted transcriptional regulator
MVITALTTAIVKSYLIANAVTLPEIPKLISEIDKTLRELPTKE